MDIYLFLINKKNKKQVCSHS